MKKDSSLLDLDAVATLGFSINPHAQHNGMSSEWKAFADRIPVFSSRELEDQINERNCRKDLLAGTPLTVGLKKVRKVNGKVRFFFRAFPLPQTFPAQLSLVADQSLSGRKPRMAVVIDGMNFLWSCADLRFQPKLVLSRLLGLYDVRLANFYVCWDAAFRQHVSNGNQVINGKQRLEMEKMRELTIRQFESVQMTTAQGNTKFKDNLDAVIAAEIAELYYRLPGVEGIVLVSGDGDFNFALCKWADSSQGGPKIIEVVAQNGRISSRLEQLNQIKFRFLDNYREW